MTRKNPAPEPTLEPTPEPEAGSVIPNPSQVVRVSLPSGHWTMTRHHAEQHGAKVLDGHPAVDRWGRWLPHKPHANLGAGTTTTEGDEPANTEE